jgi:hypothetical protein
VSRREETEVALLRSPALREVLDRFFAAREDHQRVMARAWLGALVSEFSNVELKMLCTYGVLTIGDVLDLRRLDVLDPDEGWTG